MSDHTAVPPGNAPGQKPKPKLCGIPARSLPPCDLEWGHEGDLHGSAGDGFYARDHDDEHHRRQAAPSPSPPPHPSGALEAWRHWRSVVGFRVHHNELAATYDTIEAALVREGEMVAEIARLTDERDRQRVTKDDIGRVAAMHVDLHEANAATIARLTRERDALIVARDLDETPYKFRTLQKNVRNAVLLMLPKGNALTLDEACDRFDLDVADLIEARDERDAARAEVEEMREVLREVEWNSGDDLTGTCCPCCNAGRDDGPGYSHTSPGPHDYDCTLAQAIGSPRKECP